jgi:hypothetical protein
MKYVLFETKAKKQLTKGDYTTQHPPIHHPLETH